MILLPMQQAGPHRFSPDRLSFQPVSSLFKFMNKQIQYENKKIFYRCDGEGKPVILLHGFGEDGDVWSGQTEYLKEKFRLIIPDLPGSGRSEMINDMSMEGMAEVVHAIIHEEMIDACPVIGHSMGGYITLALAEKYPNHISAFGLFHSTAYADNEEKISNRQKGIAFIQEHGPSAFLKTVTPNLFSAVSKEKMPGTITQFIERHNFSRESLVSYYQAMIKRPDRTEMLQKAVVPVLFIMGKYDMAVPLTDALRQCHLPEISYIHILHQSGHMGMMEESLKCNQVLDKFLLET